ncbi:MAG: S9 family peptidase [Planctomycetes bacterium]|nr:S9 family peptidase [Planctomycetota bacterium]
MPNLPTLLLSSLALLAARPQAPEVQGYRLPPQIVVDLATAPAPPMVDFSPDERFMIFVERDAMPTIAEVSRRWIGLAGTRVDPVANATFSPGFAKSVSFRDLRGTAQIPVELPAGSRIGGVRWSHTSRHFAVTVVTDKGTELWVADTDHPEKPRRVAQNLNGVLGGAYAWMPDGRTLLVMRVPDGRGPEPPAPAVPIGPNAQETSGAASPVRTYQDLLRTPHDETLLEYFGTSQITIVNLDGTSTPVGKPGMYSGADPSPDGKHLLVSRVHRPFSYVHPLSEFPEATEVWSLDGTVEKLVVDQPLAENIPIEGVRTGPRSIGWQPTEPATLVWCEALDDGDPRKKVDFRDRWVALAAPFSGEARELCKVQHRARGLQWMESPTRMLVTDYDRDRRWTRTQLLDLTDPSKKPVILDDRSQQDRYKNPGTLVMKLTASGNRVVFQDGDSVLRTGEGAGKGGDRPFLARQSLATLESQVLWRCAEGCYESVVDVLTEGDSSKRGFITRHETPTSPPNYLLRSMDAGRDENVVPLTKFTDPQPQIRGIQKELVTYKRKDGVELSATMYLPAGYKKGTPLPLFIWAYPLEFNDASTAGQVSGSPHRFTRVAGASHLFLLTQGYAVMDNATMPVVGSNPETVNDTFIQQIVDSAQAAIDKAVEMGVADRERVAVGGHSYGAFMTANLLAHCDLFRAGIARSGAYNRTLTPFGFQSERRTLWEAPKVYSELSPFNYAHKLKEPILFIHGEADSNTGTFPIQSDRMYRALKGTGGTARLVTLPFENHGYSAKESNLHVLAEMIEWLDKYVKNAPARPSDAGASKSAGAGGGK